MSIDIVIVNWNSGGHARDCIASLADFPGREGVLERVVVVDNASTDGSDRGLEHPGIRVEVVRNTRNRGFAAACNQGARLARADGVLFLNPDTRQIEDALTACHAFLAAPANARVGIVGVQLLDEAGRLQRSCARFPTPGRVIAQTVGLDRLLPRLFPPHFLVEWDHGETRPVEQVIGAFLLVRRRLFEELGGFDERFFVYYEDVDLCLRARAAGWETVYFTGARAVHSGGGCSASAKAHRLFYNLRSRILFAAKHFPPLGMAGTVAATLLLEPLSRLARALARGAPSEAGQVLVGTALLWGDLAGLGRKRPPAAGPP